MALRIWRWRSSVKPDDMPVRQSVSHRSPLTRLLRSRVCLRSSRRPPMPDGSATLIVTLHAHIAEIDAAAWDACAGTGNPFVSHAFLSTMEDSGSANARTGWLPQHAVLRRDGGEIVGVVPMYAKSHSYGEYVFDHGWANALERIGE